MADLGDANDYPSYWEPHERAFFDEEPNNYKELYTDAEWEDLQDAFYTGWLERDLSHEERQAARDEWYDLSGVLPESFDWEAYREYLATYVSGSLAA